MTQPSAENATPVIIEDFFPSILELAGVKKGIHTPQVVDGKSFVPFLKGKRGDMFIIPIIGGNVMVLPVPRKALLLRETGN